MRRLLPILAALSLAAAPPAALTPAQRATMAEREGLLRRADAEADPARKKALAWQAHQLLFHVEGTLTMRAAAIFGEWAPPPAARQNDFRERVFRINERLLGRWDHRTVDAYWAGEAIRILLEMPQARRDLLEKAFRRQAEADRLGKEGRPFEALRALQEALPWQKEALGEKHPRHPQALNNLAYAHDAAGDPRTALALLKEAVSLMGVLHGERHPQYATLLNNLASAHGTMGDHDEALRLFRRSMSIRKAVLGVRHADFANSHANLAGLHQVMGGFKAALHHFKEAVAVSKAARGERHPDHVTILSNLGTLHQEMGDFKAALTAFRQAVSMRRTLLGQRHPGYALALNNLAAAHQAMGDNAAALPLHKQALSIYKAALGERHPDYARSLHNLASHHQGTGDHAAALPLYKQALGIYKDTLGEKHPRHAISLLNLACAQRDMGGFEAARPLAEQALAVARTALGPRHPLYCNALTGLARLHALTGDEAKALPLAEEALARVGEQIRAASAFQSDRQQLAGADLLRHHLDARLSLADAGGRPASAGHALGWKGALLVRQQRRRLFLRLSGDAEARGAAARLRRVTGRLAALRLAPGTARAVLDDLEKEQDDAQAELARLSEAFREASGRRVAVEEVAAALPVGAVLVDYLFYRRSDMKAGKPRQERHLAAFVHARGKAPVRVDLGPAKAVEDASQAWRPLLLKRQGGSEAGAALKKLVWAPLAKHLEGAKVALVSPDGVLGTVAFAALPGSKEGSYLIEDVALAAVPVPSAIPAMVKPVRKEDRLPPSLLVAGGLRYEPGEGDAAAPAAEDTRSAPRSGRLAFAALPATSVEALSVRDSFERHFKGGRTTALTGGAATKAAVREALARVRYAHLATHGFFAPEAVRSAADGRADGEGKTPEGWHPLLLSGLALSDANREPKAGEEDGILTALEVSEMDLTRLELAVLSACETGLGKVAGGEGLLGMQRAFQAAGARAVIGSLWKVDDRATQRLMADFYAAAWDGRKIISRVEALRRAQVSMLRDGAKRGMVREDDKGLRRVPPYYWAGFVLSGDWR